MLLAEELVLLSLEPDGDVVRGGYYQYAHEAGVTGALVTELVLDGHLAIGDGRIHLTGTTPDHPLLAVALDNVAPHEGKKLKSRLGTIKHAGWAEVVDHLIERGVLGREKKLLRATRHPVLDTAAHEALLARMRAAATTETPMDDRTAALLALTGPSRLLEIVAPESSDRALAERRIAAAGQQTPAAAAVDHVVDSINAAIATTAVVATGAT